MPQPQPSAIDPVLLERAAGVIKCLGHPLRLQLLDAMEGGEMTVGELELRTGATQATVSQQLAILRGHGVVAARREGPFVRYSIIEPKVHHILACIRGCGA
ncbi:MAG TPA: metalloregulator ArsR/SmtB family transcription factor [Gemmatimonadales bacterium]